MSAGDAPVRVPSTSVSIWLCGLGVEPSKAVKVAESFAKLELCGSTLVTLVEDKKSWDVLRAIGLSHDEISGMHTSVKKHTHVSYLCDATESRRLAKSHQQLVEMGFESKKALIVLALRGPQLERCISGLSKGEADRPVAPQRATPAQPQDGKGGQSVISARQAPCAAASVPSAAAAPPPSPAAAQVDGGGASELVTSLMAKTSCSREKAILALQLEDGVTAKALRRVRDDSVLLDVMLSAKATAPEAKTALDVCNGDSKQAVRLLSSNPLELGALHQLKPHQRKALRHVAKEAERSSHASMVNLSERWDKEGLRNICNLETVLKFIRDRAQLIIHVNLGSALKFLARDTHYRNQFETNTSGGTLNHSKRKTWENRLFAGHYDNSSAFDRCKYGVLNIVHDLHGIRKCKQYGRSYMVLKEVRLRATFASKDSANSDVKLATCQHYAHVLRTYSTPELKAVAEVASGLKKWGCASTMINHYKEVQIHGPIRLDRNVEVLCAHPSELNDETRKLLQEFGNRHKVNVIEIPSE